MSDQNQAIVAQEVIKNASNLELEAHQISKLVDELEDYGQVLNASSEIASQGYESMRGTVDAIRKVSKSVQGAIDDFVSDRADAGIASGTDSVEGASTDSGDSFSNPFGRLNQE